MSRKKVEWFVKLNEKYLREHGHGFSANVEDALTFGRGIDAQVCVSKLAARMGLREGDFDVTFRFVEKE